jgi:MscS family membrane protein
LWDADTTLQDRRLAGRIILGSLDEEMVAPRKSRERAGLLVIQVYLLRLAVAVVVLAGSTLYSRGQLPTSAPPPANPEPVAKVDPLGRETPKGSLIGFLTYLRRGDYTTAARYLQLPTGQKTDLVQLAKELRVLYPSFQGNIQLLSDNPNGSVDSKLPPGQVRAGVIAVGDMNADVILVRVDDPASGKIWLLSENTLTNIPKLYAAVERRAPTATDRFRTALLSGPQLLGMSSRQWLGWLLSIPISWLLAWMLALLISAPRRVWCRIRNVPFRTLWESPPGMPLKCMIAVLLHGFFVNLLHLPLSYRLYYVRFIAALLVGCVGWLLSTLSDQGFDLALYRARTYRRGGESILSLMKTLTRIGMFIIAFIAALAFLGVNVKGALTGLGIGGLAVAFAAQKTLENVVGGVSLLLDKAIHVGDFCKIGDRLGAVEEIGLRSLKLRTLDQNLLVVPNGSLAQMQFENLQSRPKLLINQNLSLRMETRVEQLQFVLHSVQTMLNEHAAIESGTSRFRVTNLAGGVFEFELFAYGKTGDWAQLTAIRQDILFKIVGIVEAAGTRFAPPARLTYQHEDAGIDAEKANNIARRLVELRAGDAIQFPDEVQTGTN